MARRADYTRGRLVQWACRCDRKPGRVAYPLARESREFDEPIRQMLYGKAPHIYRVLFILRGNRVYVLHVRHGARRTMEPSELRFPAKDDAPS